MLDSLKLKDNKTLTENGTTTNKTTGSNMLDLSDIIEALRNSREDEIVPRFILAYTENLSPEILVLEAVLVKDGYYILYSCGYQKMIRILLLKI